MSSCWTSKIALLWVSIAMSLPRASESTGHSKPACEAGERGVIGRARKRKSQASTAARSPQRGEEGSDEKKRREWRHCGCVELPRRGRVVRERSACLASRQESEGETGEEEENRVEEGKTKRLSGFLRAAGEARCCVMRPVAV